MYAVVVRFRIAAGEMENFLKLMRENAQTSLKDEPGCHQFDVATDTSRPNEVLLYEIYSDRAAFDAHLASAHFKAFDAKITDMVLSKDVHTFDEVWT